MERIKKPQNWTALGLVLLGVSGCGMGDETFQCPAPEGVHCEQVSTINKQNKEMMDKDDQKGAQLPPVLTSSSQETTESSGPKDVMRLPEKHQKVTIGSYIDETGVFHEKSILYVVVRPPLWALKHANPDTNQQNEDKK